MNQEMTQEALQTMIAETAATAASAAVRAELAKLPPPVDPGKWMRSESGAPQRPRIEFGKEEPGLNLARYAMTVAACRLASRSRGSVPEGFAAQWAIQRFGERCPVVEALSINSSQVDKGGSWVPDTFSDEIIPLLTAKSVIRRMEPEILSMSGTLRVGRMNSGATASYVAETRPPRATRIGTGSVNLAAKKLIGVLPISNDFIRRTVSGAERKIRNNLVDALRRREDIAFIRGDGLENTPKGLKNLMLAAQQIPMTTSSTTFNVQNVQDDINLLVGALQDADHDITRGFWLGHPRVFRALGGLRTTNGEKGFPEIADGKLLSWPYAWTTQIPANLGSNSDESELYFADAAEIMIGQELDILLDIFTEGSYVDEDGNQQSLISNDETALRVISEHDIALAHDTGVALGTAVKWGT